MNTYRMYVVCRRDGFTRDAGLNKEAQCTDDQAAHDDFDKEPSWLRRVGGYDEIQTIYKRVDENWKEVAI